MASNVPTILLLLVEDEDLIIDVLEEALKESGFDVDKATNGSKALKKIDAGASKIRAVITDIKLGSGPDGWEVARHAREVAPSMPIVYMSGDSTHEWASQGVPGSIMLAKPFAPAQLVTAVASLVTAADMQPPPAANNG